MLTTAEPITHWRSLVCLTDLPFWKNAGAFVNDNLIGNMHYWGFLISVDLVISRRIVVDGKWMMETIVNHISEIFILKLRCLRMNWWDVFYDHAKQWSTCSWKGHFGFILQKIKGGGTTWYTKLPCARVYWNMISGSMPFDLRFGLKMLSTPPRAGIVFYSCSGLKREISRMNVYKDENCS